MEIEIGKTYALVHRYDKNVPQYANGEPVIIEGKTPRGLYLAVHKNHKSWTFKVREKHLRELRPGLESELLG